MALYCSREIFAALDGVRLPASKEDLLDYAEMNDAPEAVLIVLNELPDDAIFRDVSEICENASITCNYEMVSALSAAHFPATREDLMEFADRHGAPASVRQALECLPSSYTFSSVDEMCRYIL